MKRTFLWGSLDLEPSNVMAFFNLKKRMKENTSEALFRKVSIRKCAKIVVSKFLLLFYKKFYCI